MNQPTCNGCPYQFSTQRGCCRNCPQLMPQQAVPALGPAALEPSPPVSQTDLEQFLSAHPNPGTLRVQTFRGQQVFPVGDVDVTISREFDGTDKVFYQGKTNQSGIIDPILLPAAQPAETLNPEDAQSTATYTLTANHPDYVPITTVIDMFSGVKTLQMLSMNLRQEEA